MRRILLVLLVAAGCEIGRPPRGPMNCVINEGANSGFFHVVYDCKRYWLATPDDKPFWSFGVNHVAWTGDRGKDGSNPYADTVQAKYENEDAWADATAERLKAWGWNTIGSWSSPSMGERMPYTFNLQLAQAAWQTGELPDYFDEGWANRVGELAVERIGDRADDPNLIGWFIDNELRWGPDWRASLHLFDEYLAKPADAPGKKALVAVLEERHETIERFNEAWGTNLASFAELMEVTRLPKNANALMAGDRDAFLARLGERFFSVTVSAIRAVDPNHLILGVRFVAGLVPVEIAKAAGRWLDVVSVNAYEFALEIHEVWRPGEFGFVDLSEGEYLEALHQVTGRPLLISEFGFRAADSGMPNSWPPQYPTLDTQAERADRYEAYAKRALASPWIVGMHWFEWCDQPPVGRFDGEDNNWGLVNNDDEPYEVLVERTAKVNVAP